MPVKPRCCNPIMPGFVCSPVKLVEVVVVFLLGNKAATPYLRQGILKTPDDPAAATGLPATLTAPNLASTADLPNPEVRALRVRLPALNPATA